MKNDSTLKYLIDGGMLISFNFQRLFRFPPYNFHIIIIILEISDQIIPLNIHPPLKKLRVMTVFFQFVIFKPLSYCFEKTIRYDVKASFISRPVSRLIRWYNKPGDITKEFWYKAIQFHGTFHGLKITNWFGIMIICKEIIIRIL